MLTASLLLAASCNNKPPRGEEDPISLQQVRGNLYVLYGPGGNVGILATDEGVVLIDNKFERLTPILLEQVALLSDEPVRYVLNTHHHGDHAGANPYFLDKAVVIGHEKARGKMLEGFMPGPPPVVFRESTTLRFGGSTIRAIHMGRGHTEGDVVIHFPELGVLMTGDLYINGSAPFVDYAGGGSALAWDDTLANVEALDYDIVVPGHGPVAGPEDLARWRTDFRTFRERLRPLAEEGVGVDEALERVDVSDLVRWTIGRPQYTGLEGMLEELRDPYGP